MQKHGGIGGAARLAASEATARGTAALTDKKLAPGREALVS